VNEDNEKNGDSTKGLHIKEHRCPPEFAASYHGLDAAT
jgi:hypothetical protein